MTTVSLPPERLMGHGTSTRSAGVRTVKAGQHHEDNRLGKIQPYHQALGVRTIHPGPDEEPKEQGQVAVEASPRSSSEQLSLKISRGSAVLVSALPSCETV